MTMRVLQVIDHLGTGGGQVSTRTIFRGLAGRDGVNVHLCALRSVANEIRVDLPVTKLRVAKYDPRAASRLLKLCREQQIDVCHAQLDKAILAALMARRHGGPPVVVHERGSAIFGGFGPRVYRLFLRRLHHAASIIIANSKASERALQDRLGIPADRIRLLYNPIDLSSLHYSPSGRQAVRCELGLTDRAFVVGYLGHLHPVKGVDALVKAVPLMLERIEDLHVVIAGDGPERRRLERLVYELNVAGRVHFLGMRQDVSQTVSAYDVAVMPSRQEPFGRVAVEMMQIGLPLIASRADGLAELAIDGQNALVLPARAPDAICEAVGRLWQSPELRDQLVQGGRAFAQQFSVDSHISGLLGMYQQAVGVGSEGGGGARDE